MFLRGFLKFFLKYFLFFCVYIEKYIEEVGGAGSSVTLARCRARALPRSGAELRVTVLMKAKR